jgi:hypothetical protein
MSLIIPELSDLLNENKLIPFVGAGFSKGCGCPSAHSLAQQLLLRFEIHKKDLPADEDIDLLRLAEYLKIIRDGDISDVLRQIRSILNEDSVDIAQSQAHLLLAQLGVPIIYTTNYDCLIEKSFDHLDIPHQTVVHTEDIIKAAGSSITQIVKFHGSLEQDGSIVLTESDYYKRLEFVTPIDIKLRADALGKSILFMGYSFSDFNVRYLWFKLRHMMRGVDQSEIPNSFILVTKPDVITTTVFRHMGIIPIDLATYQGASKTERLCFFLRSLPSP